jgi:FtsH-binding integral membrane protein
MFATRYAESTVAKADTRGKQYLGFFIYILAEAFIFVPLLMIRLAVGGSAILLQAFYLTLALFIGLSLVVFMTKKDFSFLRSAITIGGVIAMGLIVVGMIFGFDLGLWFSVGMVVLAAGSILYQTSNLIHKYNRDQYVLASLGLFASFMLLLWYILSILLDRS